ncbi:hypothetical protein J2Z27_000986 [Jeotgalicoccus aerolatus]|uniref:Uncharacterized protein n=1 Tax=Jeotgalicoccus aerolatus TaxID=709510 RepID=A0ABS4HLZ8_9STAP|nr:hypothetical protein [Jeotgalicoccus aerolatus]
MLIIQAKTCKPRPISQTLLTIQVNNPIPIQKQARRNSGGPASSYIDRLVYFVVTAKE